MKILFVATSFPCPQHSGDKIRTFNLLKAFSKKGRITFICMSDQEPEADNLSFIKKYCEDVILVDRKSDLYHRMRNKKMPLSERLRRFLMMEPWQIKDRYSEQMQQELYKVNLKKYDVVIFRYAHLAQHVLNNPDFRDMLCKTVVDVDDLTTRIYERRLQDVSLGCKKIREYIDFVFLVRYYKKLKRVLCCFVTSEPDRIYMLKNKMAGKVIVIPNAVDIGPFEGNQSETAGRHILFCGNLNFPFNTEGLRFFCKKVFPIIREQIPDCAFDIIGKNPKASVLELGNQKGVNVIGFVKSTYEYYKKAAIVIVPLLNGGGTRIKILEAMALKRPVVSTSIGAEGLDVVGDRDICLADQPHDFAEKCINLLSDPAKRKTIADKAFEKFREKYSFLAMDGKISEFFANLHRPQ